MYLKRLKDLREDNDLTQENISEILKISRPQYSLYETGKRDIPVDLLTTLAKYYKTSIDYIVGLTDTFEKYPKIKIMSKYLIVKFSFRIYNFIYILKENFYMYKRIKELRLENNLTQEELSRKLEISRISYSLYESSKRKVPLKILMKLAKEYNTSIDYIVGNTDKKSCN